MSNCLAGGNSKGGIMRSDMHRAPDINTQSPNPDILGQDGAFRIKMTADRRGWSNRRDHRRHQALGLDHQGLFKCQLLTSGNAHLQCLCFKGYCQRLDCKCFEICISVLSDDHKSFIKRKIGNGHFA